MLFDQSRELPQATVRRAPEGQIALWFGDLQRWLAARWSWLRPRTVPMLVAIAGMFAVLHAVDYLAHPPPPRQPACVSINSGQPSDPPAGTPNVYLVRLVGPSR